MASRASAKTIDLNCPGCGALLQLDRGFAGGVCRCSTCGTLMTVPKLRNEKAEELVRAERPGEQPGQRPDRPARPEAPGQRPRKTSMTRNARPTSAPRAPEPVADEPSETGAGEQVYRTASGREVKVDAARVPMAESKRKAIRAATVAVFVAVVGGVLALCGLAAYMLVTQPTAEEIAAATYVETFSYDDRANPYAIEAPNLLGLPLSNRVALVLDPAEMSGEAWETTSNALIDGLSREAGAVRASVYLLDPEGGYRPVVDREALGSVDVDGVREALREVGDEATGVSLEPAVARALEYEPEVLIVVTGRSLRTAEASAVASAVPEGGVRFDALLIDADSFDLEDLARRTGGHYATLDPAYDLEAWLPVE
ncbi:MAG: hypothetical protein AAF328_04875 [Planctomycetota bacterium]